MITPRWIGVKAERAAGWRLCAALALWIPLPALAQTPPATAPAARAAQAVPWIESRADAILRAASDYLAAAPSFTVKVEIREDRLLRSGQTRQVSRAIEAHVRRPDRFYARVRAAGHNQEFWYDGRVIVLLDRDRRFYSSVDAPATLDAALDFAEGHFGINFALGDMLVSDPYADVIRNVWEGRYLGQDSVLNTACHHLAFTQDQAGWQIWIEDGPRPLIRKILITSKDGSPGPRFDAVFKDWDLDVRPTDPAFDFGLPRGVARIQVHSGTAEGSEAYANTAEPHAQPAADRDSPAATAARH